MFGKAKVKLSEDHRWKNIQPQKGPQPNGQKYFGRPFWSLLDPFGPLWNIDKPAMFGRFWSKMDHVWAIHIYIYSANILKHIVLRRAYTVLTY